MKKEIPLFPNNGTNDEKLEWCAKYIKFEEPTDEDIQKAKESFDNYDKSKSNEITISELLESAQNNIKSFQDIIDTLPPEDSMDYDPGAILMRIESIAHKGRVSTVKIFRKITE